VVSPCHERLWMQSVSIVFLVRFPSITKCTRYSLIEQDLLVTSLWEVTFIWVVRLWVRFSPGVLSLQYNNRFTYLQRSLMLLKKYVAVWVTGLTTGPGICHLSCRPIVHWYVAIWAVHWSLICCYLSGPLVIDMLLSERSTGHWYVAIWAVHWSLPKCQYNHSISVFLYTSRRCRTNLFSVKPAVCCVYSRE
jgi:hypothetical protein